MGDPYVLSGLRHFLGQAPRVQRPEGSEGEVAWESSVQPPSETSSVDGWGLRPSPPSSHLMAWPADTHTCVQNDARAQYDPEIH